ncbi:MAG TPA: phosphatase PAP2 family protein, partial [Acidimicrobiales bacterium]
GHASAGFFAATLLSEGDPALAPLWFALAAVVATSRAYVRIHHASDIVAGAAVGLALAAVARRVWPQP